MLLKAYFKESQHEEYRKLNHTILICCEAMHYYCFWKFFDDFEARSISNHFISDWYIYMKNSYYDCLIRNWYMIFGADGENLHYSNLLGSKEILKKLNIVFSLDNVNRNYIKMLIRDAVSMDEEEYKNYHNQVKDYRNKWLIHRITSPMEVKTGDVIKPISEPMKESLVFIYFVLVCIVKEYQKENQSNGKFELTYINASSKEDIEHYFEQSLLTLNPIFEQMIRTIKIKRRI